MIRTIEAKIPHSVAQNATLYSMHEKVGNKCVNFPSNKTEQIRLITDASEKLQIIIQTKKRRMDETLTDGNSLAIQRFVSAMIEENLHVSIMAAFAALSFPYLNSNVAFHDYFHYLNLAMISGILIFDGITHSH